MDRLFWRRFLISGIITIVLLVAGYLFYDYLASRESPVRQMSFRESVKNVKATEIEYKSREISISGLGRVISENAIDLISEVQGEIERGAVPIRQGQSFSAGQILFKVDDEEARLSLSAQKSGFMNAVATILPDLRIDFSAAYPKWQAYFDQLDVEKSLPNMPEISDSKEKVFLSTRNIINQYYTIKSAEERLSKYIVKAPFSGSFIDVIQEEGSVVNPGSRVARIARSNRLELELPVRKEDLPYISRNMTVDVFSEDSEKSWKGRITRIGSILDPATQAVNVYLTLNSSRGEVFEGQFLRVEVPGSRLKNVMEIPRDALVSQNEVYTITDSSRLQLSKVSIEKINKESVFFSGLEEGKMVVVEPLFNAYDNMPVTFSEESSAPQQNQ